VVKKFVVYRIKNRVLPYTFIFPAMFFLIMLMVYPMFVIVRYSLLDNVITNPTPVFVGLQHYVETVKDEVFRLAVLHTLFFTVMSVIFHLLIGLCFAMLLNAPINRILRSLLRVFFILPWLFTATIVAINWRLILDPMGIVNYILQKIGLISSHKEWFSTLATALPTVTFVNIWAGYPFYMISLLAGLQGIPRDMYEAALVDGANSRQQFFSITIPHLMPIIMSISLLDFIWTMRVFPLIWTATGGGPIHATEVVATYTYKQAFNHYQYSAASASAFIILLMSMTMAFFYIKNQKRQD
jgi:multiple sugar transport system permease protein